MSNRFTRNIQNVENIQNLPLYTNDQNDLVSTKDMVYVRHNNAYEPILNKAVLGSGLTPQDVDRIKGIIDDKFKGYTEGAIKELNDNDITELEQSILNLIGDRLGGLKFDQDGFKTSLNEVLKRLELSEIADVQNLQREIEYVFDENNKSTSKKIDEVKSELSQMIDEKVQAQSTPVKNSPIIDIVDNVSILQDDIYNVSLNIYCDEEIDISDLKSTVYNYNTEEIKNTQPITPYGQINIDDMTLYVYNLGVSIEDNDYIIITYKNKIIKIISSFKYDYLNNIRDNQKYINQFNSRIEELEQKVQELEKQ